jgi:transcriptional regulator of NAD metabolism
MALLNAADGPVTGADLADRLGVSRQVVVQDVAVMRAGGETVVATPQGYLAPGSPALTAPRRVIAVRHDAAQTPAELRALVDAGVRVLDVVVEHPLYGELRGMLHLSSRREVDAFLAAVQQQGAHLLSELTEGVHLHSVEASDGAALEEALASLRRLGFLLEGQDGPDGSDGSMAP